MPPTPSGRIETILAEAVEIASAEERSRYLDQACGDSEVRQQVGRLIANHFQAGSFLERPAGDLVVTQDSVPNVEAAGTQIGP